MFCKHSTMENLPNEILKIIILLFDDRKIIFNFALTSKKMAGLCQNEAILKQLKINFSELTLPISAFIPTEQAKEKLFWKTKYKLIRNGVLFEELTGNLNHMKINFQFDMYKQQKMGYYRILFDFFNLLGDDAVNNYGLPNKKEWKIKVSGFRSNDIDIYVKFAIYNTWSRKFSEKLVKM